MTPGNQAEHKAMSGVVAVLWAALSSGLLAVMWIIVRKLSDHIHPLEITFFSAFFGFLVFLPTVLPQGLRVFRSSRLTTHFIRAAFNGTGIMAWFLALTLMPLADAAALSLLVPLAVSVGAMIFLKEPMGPRRWFALVFGAFGALVVAQPGYQSFNLGVLLVMVMVFAAATQRIIAKFLTRTESSSTSVLYVMLFMSPLTLIVASFVWTWPELEDYPWLFAIGALLSAGHFAFMRSISLADVSAMEPVNFTRIVWAALLGFIFFYEVPQLSTWVGGLMIISATTYVAHREASMRRNRNSI
ncbi:DMT family transporter [Pseudomonadota bacterium]